MNFSDHDTVALTDLTSRLTWEYSALRSAIELDPTLLTSVEDRRHAIESLDAARDKLEAAQAALNERGLH